MAAVAPMASAARSCSPRVRGSALASAACLGTESCLAAAASFVGGAYCLKQGGREDGQLVEAASSMHDAVVAPNDRRVACIVGQVKYWTTLYVDALQARHPQPQYTGMNLLGTCQAASGVPDASVGHPVTSAGSACGWMVMCVHPKYGTPTANAVGQAMWDLWLANRTAA